MFEGEGRLGDYVGGYTDWQNELKRPVGRWNALPSTRSEEAKRLEGKPLHPKPKKLTNKEREELAELPARIETWEKEQAELTARLADPGFYKTQAATSASASAAQFAEVKARLDAVERGHATAFARWEGLEVRRAE